jgi:hypothetical protein
VIVAGVHEHIAAAAIADAVRACVEAAEHDRQIDRVAGRVRKVDAPEVPRLLLALQQEPQHRRQPPLGQIPVELALAADVLRHGDGMAAEQRGLACGCDGAGGVDVRAEVCALIDTGEHPRRLRGEVCERQARTIGRPAVDAIAALADRVDAQRRVGGDLMADTRLRRSRRHDGDLAERRRDALQDREAGSVDAVIVGYDDRERHAAMVTGSAGVIQ